MIIIKKEFEKSFKICYNYMKKLRPFKKVSSFSFFVGAKRKDAKRTLLIIYIYKLFGILLLCFIRRY